MRSIMATRWFRWVLAGLQFLIVFPPMTHAQEYVGRCHDQLEQMATKRMDMAGPNKRIYYSNQRWNSDRTKLFLVADGVEYVCECVAENRPPVCKPTNSSGSTGSSDIDLSGLNPGQQLAVTAVQSLIRGLFKNIYKSPAKDNAASEAAALRAQEEFLRKQQEERQKSIDQYNDYLTREKERARLEKDEARKSGQELLDKMGATGGQGLSMQSISGEKLDFNQWMATKPESQPLPGGKYPAPKTALEQARCAAYFSEKARKLSAQGKNEEAEFMSLQAQKAMSGEPLDVPCEAAAATAVPVPESAAVQEIIEQYNVKVTELLKLAKQMDDLRKQKFEAELAVNQAEGEITRIKTQAESVTEPQEKQKLNDLLKEAEALKSESERALKVATDNEEALKADARKAEDEVQKLGTKLQESKGKK